MKIKKNIAVSETGFVFDPSTGESFTLNGVGTEIIEMLRKGINQAEITSDITSRYDVDSASFERYYYDFISTLKLFQLIEDYE
ncbi:MAG TPA: HPr-rel-A system PqqD family peptide chaperone [Tenuifilaceae bacterium]|nr:HPr-rel-A system PqqD family peptide chaperone [Tenuifilaceae bacterium]HPE17056.1 HPr-rel-A system PqqD family peptide chaperone [Tenuifilaceae bacterium]HPJ44659.1 HPr-rel-A system PqqD family peptide chaperone [Tenuifilaceae bacterium]HPQ32922.1 HPr-rel-A system PqqD family peptide chaperone [Tenuifilaceae bacterium]HRX66740.1 HPr-rel-A system PqqD family peptide chaperone [Tenuifilaceae bacterium]